MDKPRYTVAIVIAAPGTPLVDEKGVQKVANGSRRPPRPGTCSTCSMGQATLRGVLDSRLPSMAA